jgi:hypothetical protein
MKTMAEGDPAPAPAPAPADAKWFAGFDAETQNYITQRGLADKDPSAAFLEAAKAHREAQAYIGVPKEQLLKLPAADAKPEEWDAVYEKLGYSKNADDYKLDALKNADGTEVDAATKDFIRAQAVDLKLSPAAAAKFGEAYIKQASSGAAAQSATQLAEATRAMEALRQSWGPNYEANKVIADNAYAAIMAAANFDQAKMSAAIQKLGETAGRAETMQMLLAVGLKLGEDKFVSGGGPSGGVRYTKETATARISELKADSAFVTRYLGGGIAENKEMADLHLLAYGDN